MSGSFAISHSVGGSPSANASAPLPSHLHLLGSSPPISSYAPGSASQASKLVPPGASSSDKQAPYAAAKKFLRRIQHDPSLDPSEFTVGFVESVQQQVRQSGVGAWSLRVHNQVHDIPYLDFIGKYSEEGDTPIPFHRIAYFKLNQRIVWEAEPCRKAPDSRGSSSYSNSAGRPPRPSDGRGSSFMPGSSPPTRHLFSERSAVSGDLLGGSSDDDEEVGEQLTDADDDDDMVAGTMEGDGLPSRGQQAVQQQQHEVQLPEECWVSLLHALAVRDICMMGRVNRWLHQLSSCPTLWQEQYERIFGEPPKRSFNAATVRRMCRRSEIRAARWLEADVYEQPVGYPDTTCLQLDDSKVVSSDGSAVRVWSHASGRRIATLKGHLGAVTGVAYDDNLVVSGCSQGSIRVWGMDDLKCCRTFRTAHEGGVAGVALLNGMPVSAGADGCVRLWDVSSAQPIMALDGPRNAPLAGLDVLPQSGYLVTCGDGVHIWDAASVQLLHDLGLPEMEHEEEHQAWGGLLGGVAALGLVGAAAAPPALSAGMVGSGGVQRRGFRCVAYSGSVLAAALGSRAVIFDPRCAVAVGSVRAPAAVIASSGVSSSSAGPCTALALDDWKLVAAFDTSPSESVIGLYDMRAVPACSNSGWPKDRSQALQVLPAPGRVQTIKFHNQLLMAGLAGADCMMWMFKPPGSAAPTLPGATQRTGPWDLQPGPNGSTPPNSYGAAGSWGGELLGRSPATGELGGSPPGAADDARRRKGGKPAKMVKKQNRYPKRKQNG